MYLWSAVAVIYLAMYAVVIFIILATEVGAKAWLWFQVDLRIAMIISLSVIMICFISGIIVIICCFAPCCPLYEVR